MSSTELPGARFGDWISEGWKMFTQQWKSWVLLSLGYFVVMLVPTIVLAFVVFSMTFANAALQSGPYGRSASAASPFPFLIVFVGSMLSLVVLVPVSAYFKGGMYKSAFKQLRGGRLEFRDLFSAGDRLLPLIGETILVSLVVSTGMMFCIIPGLVAAGLLMFAAPLTVERRMGVIEAMRESYEMTKQNILIFTLFAFIVQLIVSAGTYLCYIGLLATYPLMFTISACAYRDCFGLSGALSFRDLNPAALPAYATPNTYEPPQAAAEPPSAPVPPSATFYTYDPPPRAAAEPPSAPAPPSATFYTYDPPSQAETPEPPLPPGATSATPEASEAQAETTESEIPNTSARPPEPQGTSCPGCHTQLPSTATFCFRCGTKVRG